MWPPAPRPSDCSRTAGSRNSRPCSTAQAETISTLCGADQACGATQSTTARPSPSRTTVTRFRWENAVTPLSGAEAGDSSWILIGDDSEALKPLVDTLTARGQRYRFLQLPASDAGRGEARSDVARRGSRMIRRCVSCTSPHSTPAPPPRCGHCCGCNTRSWPERGGSSAPRSPLTCGRPSGWSPAGHSASPRRDTVTPEQSCPVGIRPRRGPGASSAVGRSGRSRPRGTSRRMVRSSLNRIPTASRIGRQGRPGRAAGPARSTYPGWFGRWT